MPKFIVMRRIIISTMVFTMIINTLYGQEQPVSTDSHEHSGTGIVFSGFPLHDEDYTSDVIQIKEKSIERFGEEEWRLNVLTSELHGHLGIYAIIGSKMGLFAREVLGAGHDELHIVSLAGSKPPVSCLNDGLQVSTGATLGHGLISIKQVDRPLPAAEFTYKGTSVSISLKETIMNDIDRIVKETVVSSGGLTEEYWHRIREQALDYWLKLDRKEIFSITENK